MGPLFSAGFFENQHPYPGWPSEDRLFVITPAYMNASSSVLICEFLKRHLVGKAKPDVNHPISCLRDAQSGEKKNTYTHTHTHTQSTDLFAVSVFNLIDLDALQSIHGRNLIETPPARAIHATQGQAPDQTGLTYGRPWNPPNGQF